MEEKLLIDLKNRLEILKENGTNIGYEINLDKQELTITDDLFNVLEREKKVLINELKGLNVNYLTSGIIGIEKTETKYQHVYWQFKFNKDGKNE